MKYGVRAPVAMGFNQFDGYASLVCNSLRASSPIWASESAPLRVLTRVTLLTQIGELARRLGMQKMLHPCEKSALQTTWGRNQGT